MGRSTTRSYLLEALDVLMVRFFEGVYPYVVGILIAGIFVWIHAKFPAEREILTASITIGAIFIGFLATAEAIVISLQGPRAEQFRGTKFFGVLLRYTQESIIVSIVYCCTCLAGYFAEEGKLPLWYGAAWVFLTTASILTFHRVSRILM